MMPREKTSDRLISIDIDLLNNLNVAVECREVDAMKMNIEVHPLDAVDSIESREKPPGIEAKHIKGSRFAVSDEEALPGLVPGQGNRSPFDPTLEPRKNSRPCAL